MTKITESNSLRQIWKDVLELLRKSNSSHNFNSWLKDLTLEELTEETALILAADEFKAAWVMENYLVRLVDALADTIGRSVEVTVTHQETYPREPKATQIMLPNIREEERMAPNALVRSALFGIVRRGRRKYADKKLIESWREWSILYTGRELDQGDMDVWLQCLRLMSEQELGKPIHFSARGFLKALGRRTGKSDYEWLDRSLTRLKANALEVRRDNFAYVGSLINEYYKDDDANRFVLVLNPKLTGFFGLGLTRIQFLERLGFRRQLSKWLHFYIHSQRATPEQPHRIGLERLQGLCGSTTKQLWKFRQQLRESMKEIESLGVVTAWCITDGDALEFVRPYPRKNLK